MGEYKANTSQVEAHGNLFPIFASGMRGLQRLASEAEHADDGYLVEFRSMEVRSILNRSESKRRLSLAYSINPYRGCEFGCKYCYARYTHEFLSPRASEAGAEAEAGAGGSTGQPDLRRPEAFERLIFLKKNAAWLLEQELRKIDPGDEIALGTATDPYQPIERRAMVTRGILEVFARKEGFRLGIVTKSTLIERDIDLLSRIAERNTLVVHVTITTPEAELARKLEPRAPRPDLRLAAVRRLREAGIRTGILCSPLLPGITDTERAIDRMAKRAAQVDASFFAAEPLFLKPCSRPTFLSFVDEHFPALKGEYATRFRTAEFAGRAYREQMARLVTAACRRHGIGERSTEALLTRDTGVMAKRPGRATGVAQGRLFA